MTMNHQHLESVLDTEPDRKGDVRTVSGRSQNDGVRVSEVMGSIFRRINSSVFFTVTCLIFKHSSTFLITPASTYRTEIILGKGF